MIIKTNGFELEISEGFDVYLGSKKTGQMFKKWTVIDEDIKAGLESIIKQTEILVKSLEELLSTPAN